MLVIGLIGSFGSGKSTVKNLLQEKGAVIIDADEVGHSVYKPGSDVWKKIIDAWGVEILQPDDEIDRVKLGSIVFSDQKELERLNQIVHPAIEGAISRRFEELRANNTPTVVLEAAILIEAGWRHLVDEVWLVNADRDVVLKRLMEDKGLTEQQVKMRLDRQMPVEEKTRYSDVVIENDGDIVTLRNTLDNLWAERFGNSGSSERSIRPNL